VSQLEIIAGEQGLVLMKYTGVGDIDTYTGKVTGTGYPFGLLRRKGYVDKRDVQGLLSTIEDTLPVFEVS
jgi:hypothetical protein